MNCLCEGRGWVLPPGEEWWEYCAICLGQGTVCKYKAARVLGVTPRTIDKIDRGEKVRRKSLLTVLERYHDLKT